jgi:hypothetical protein
MVNDEDYVFEEEPLEEASIEPEPTRLKSIPLSIEQKEELKQAQSRLKAKPVRPKAGMRVLFFSRLVPGLYDGIIREVSRSGAYIHLEGEFTGTQWEKWVERDQILEELGGVPPPPQKGNE